MDAAASTHRAARLLGPYQLVRGVTQTLTCPMYASGALVAPSSGTITIERPGGDRLVDEAAVTVASSRATYSLLSTVLADTESLGGQWQVIWTLTFASGVSPEIVRSEATVVRRTVALTVTDADLYRRVKSLDPAGSAVIHSESTFQDKIDEAWGVILRGIIAEGKRPDLITTPSALRDAVMLLTLAYIFEDFGTRLNENYLVLADRYRAEYRDELKKLSYGYDASDSGNQPATRTRRGGPLWAGGTPL